jgi:aminoglycoside phosphotransferase (APT) family kinase protein
LDWIDGDALDEVDNDGFSAGQKLGDLLHRLHQIRVSGVGLIRNGAWEASDFGSFIAENVQRFSMLPIQELLEIQDLRSGVLRELSVFVERCRDARIEPRLLHGDIGLDNIIRQGADAIVLIDPGWCIGGDPLLDVSYFLVLTGDPAVSAGFRDGYLGYDALDCERLRSWTIYHHVAKLLCRIESGNREGVEAWKRRLSALLHV